MITDQVFNLWNDIEALEIKEKGSILKRICTNLTKLALNYFTIWILLFHLLFYSGFLKDFQASLLLLSVVVSINGFILVYFYPKKMPVKYLNFTADGKGLFNTYIGDFIFHQLPLIFLLMNYDNRIPPDSLVFGCAIGALYIITQNYDKVYNLKCKGCRIVHGKDTNLVKKCLLTCGIFNFEIIILLLLLLYILVNQLLVKS